MLPIYCRHCDKEVHLCTCSEKGNGDYNYAVSRRDEQLVVPGLEAINETIQKRHTLTETMPIISQKAIWQNNENHGWHNPSAPLATDLLLIHSEISEACEALRDNKLRMADGKDSVEEELADAVIRIFHVCEKNGFDIAEAVKIKHMKNIDREYRHGNKAF